MQSKWSMATLKRPQKSSIHNLSWPRDPSSILCEWLPSLLSTLLDNLMRIQVGGRRRGEKSPSLASMPDQANDQPWFIRAGSSFRRVAGCFMEPSKPYCKSLEGKQEGWDEKKGNEIQHKWWGSDRTVRVSSSYLEEKVRKGSQSRWERKIKEDQCFRTSCWPHSVRQGWKQCLWGTWCF